MQYLKKCEELFELNASAKVDSIQRADEVMSKANAKVYNILKVKLSTIHS